MDLLRFALLGLGAGSVYALAGQGIVLVYRGSGVLNFAHGALGMVGAFAFFALRDAGVPLAVAAVATIALGAGLGAAIARGVMQPLRDAPALSRLIATLALLTGLLGLGLAWFGTTPRLVDKLLPVGPVRFGADLVIGRDRLVLLAIAVGLTLLLRWIYGRTAFGLATTATAENRVAAAAQGVSPDLIAAVNWALGGVLAVISATLVVNLSGLQVVGLTLLVVPGLAAALVGDFRSFPGTLAGGLLIGILESELAFMQTRLGTSATLQGLSRAVPFVVIIVVMVVRGRSLPLRSYVTERPPEVGSGRIRPLALVLAASVVVTATLGSSPSTALVIAATAGAAVLAVSLTVVTGYAGQLSLAQFALAGAGAWAAARTVTDLGWPFELALVVGVIAAVPIGLVVAVPSLRTRGVNLAIATLALALVIESMLLNNADLTGGLTGIRLGDLRLFGIDIDTTRHPQRYATIAVVLLTAVGVLVANLRRSRAGRRLVAVRSNERAAAALGIDVVRAKLFAFGLAAAIASVGGMILAFRRPTVVFTSFSFFDSIVLVVHSVIGGIGYVIGAVAGALLAPSGLARSVVGGWLDDPARVQLGLGVLLLVVLFWRPDGLASWRPWSRRTSVSAAGSPVPRPEVAGAVPLPTGEPARLRVDSITVDFGGVRALDDVSFDVEAGTIVGVIGPNGAGKTTLLDAVAGAVRTRAGRVLLDDLDVSGARSHRRALAGIGRSFQSLELFETMTVRENLRTAADDADLGGYLTGLVAPRSGDTDDRASAVAAAFGLTDVLDQRPDELPYGRRRLVAIARAVAAGPRCLLLDEPAAGLDDAATRDLGELLRRMAGEAGTTLVLVEHDLSLVLSLCDRVIVLAEGRTIADGAPDEIQLDSAVQEAYLGTAAATATRVLEAPRGGEPPEVLLKASGLDAGYGDVPVVRGLDLEVGAGSIVALLGPNGAGKTTTLLTLAGELPAIAGDVAVLGSAPDGLHRQAARGVSLVPEERAIVPSLTVLGNLRLGGDVSEAAFERFPELRDLRNRRAGLLSGGEQQMLALGRALGRGPRLLLVDELSLGLAPRIVDRLMEHLVDAAADGVGVLLVEQHARRALDIADEAYVLRNGQVVLSGPAHTLDAERVTSAYLGHGEDSMDRERTLALTDATTGRTREAGGPVGEPSGSADQPRLEDDMTTPAARRQQTPEGRRPRFASLRANDVAPYGLVPIVLLLLVNLLDRIETSVVSGALPLLQDEWGFSDTWAGAIPTAIVIAGMLVVLPAGYLADRANRTRLLAVIVASWSVITLSSALATSFAIFFGTRIVLGMADSIDNPVASTLITDYYPPKARSRAFGYQRISIAVGAALGAGLGGVIGEALGWRWAFGAAVVPGLVLAWFLVRLPEPIRGSMDRFIAARDRGVAQDQALAQLAAEVEDAGSGGAEGSPTSADADVGIREAVRGFLRDVRELLRIPTVRLLYPGLTVAFTGLGGLTFWLPSFLERGHDIGEGRAASLAALILGGGALLGAVVGGTLGDRWHGRTPGARMRLVTWGLVGGFVLLTGAMALDALGPQVLALFVAMFGFGVATPNFFAVMADVLPGDRRGAGFALFQLIVNIGLALGPILIGVLSDVTGSLRRAIVALTPLAVIGVAVVMRAARSYEEDAQRVLAGTMPPPD